MPLPKVGYCSRFTGAPSLWLAYTRLPTMRVPSCGARRSESSVFGTMPDMLFRQTERVMVRSPPAFVPE